MPWVCAGRLPKKSYEPFVPRQALARKKPLVVRLDRAVALAGALL
jgi:hypothetical protein